MNNQIVVLGGGASGMMAAIIAARNGAHVTILEQNDRLGKKILATGNGKCNLTNRYQDLQCYRSEKPERVKAVLEQFSVEDTLKFFGDLGIYPTDKNGYIYPNSGQASSILDVLRFEVEALGIKVLTDTAVKAIEENKTKGYLISYKNGTNDHKKIQTDKIIFATGSKAGNVSGADGSGYQLARKLGIKVIPPLPALVQLKCKENFYKSLSGVRVQGKVTLLVDQQPVAEDKGEIQLTAYGISGIPVFQVSRFASLALSQGKEVAAILDFAPEFSKEALLRYFMERRERKPERMAQEFLLGFMNKKLSHTLLKCANFSLAGAYRDILDEQLEKLVTVVKEMKTVIADTNGFAQAQVCCGGISLEEVDEHLESVKKKGIFFAGECLDVDGICGGYNLQWAWSSGYVAGKYGAQS